MNIRPLTWEEIREKEPTFRRLTTVPQSDMNILLQVAAEGGKSPLIAAFVAEDRGFIIGWAVAETSAFFEATLLSIFIDHDFRERGIGHALAKTLWDDIKDRLPHLVYADAFWRRYAGEDCTKLYGRIYRQPDPRTAAREGSSAAGGG